MTPLPRTGPALHRLRRAVTGSVADVEGLLLVACSGGPDSLALAAAVAVAGRPAGAADRRPRTAGGIRADRGDDGPAVP